MFHLLFVPRYLDYVQTDLGRRGGGGWGESGAELLSPVKEVVWRDFFILPPLHHFHPVSPIW